MEMEKENVNHLVQQWLDLLAQKDLEGILELYCPEAALMPTLRNKIHKTRDERKEYFEFFLSFPKLHGTIISQYSRFYGNVAINTGVYKFLFLQNGLEAEIFARFSFIHKKENDRWLIVDHHSSAFPEKI